MRDRRKVPWKTAYASALLALGDVSYDDAKEMHEDQMISRYELDHNKLHALGGGDHFSNLTPMLVAQHREKSRRDTAIVAKVRRIERKHEDFRNRVLAVEKKPREKSSRWASRPFRRRPA